MEMAFNSVLVIRDFILHQIKVPTMVRASTNSRIRQEQNIPMSNGLMAQSMRLQTIHLQGLLETLVLL